MVHDTRNQQLLTPLRDSIINKPPYISGTLQLPDSCFSLFYKTAKDGPTARYINLANATPEDLEQLAQACEPASFGVKQELVLDETYRKAGKMDSGSFSSTLDDFHTDLIKIIRGYLLEGSESTRGIKAELYKLNVYSKGSFFKPHVDTPRSEKMFGSLVVVFPTPHEDGALFLRHHGQEWTFDSSQALAAVQQPAIGYVAFFSDIEHEVAPVTSGHRVTLTYNLYFDDGGPGPGNDPVSQHPISPQPPNRGGFCEAFKALLEDPEFMADGGMLAFGLRHVYPIKKGLNHLNNALKGSDAVVYQSMRELGFEPVLYVYYREDRYSDSDSDQFLGAMVDELIEFDGDRWGDQTIPEIVREKGGILVHHYGCEMSGDSDFKVAELMEWVTPVTRYNRQEGAFAYHGNEMAVGWAYGDICMAVRIGKADDRLGYPRHAQVKRAYEQERN